MERRAADYRRDAERLLAMQRVSWEINFPGRAFRESSFRVSLRAGIDHGDVSVYEDGGEVVGWLWLDRYEAGIVHIRHIQVARERWGEGIGRQIMGDAIAIAVEEGRRAVTLNVTKSNQRAVSLYVYLGFRITADDGERQRMKLDLPRSAARVGRHRDHDVNGSEEDD
jgi:ribosomal protein S18 acetylase RimI-like enzyme